MTDDDYDKAVCGVHEALMSGVDDLDSAIGVSLSVVIDLMDARGQCCLAVPIYGDDKSWAINISSHDGHCEELDRQLQGGEYVH